MDRLEQIHIQDHPSWIIPGISIGIDFCPNSLMNLSSFICIGDVVQQRQCSQMT